MTPTAFVGAAELCGEKDGDPTLAADVFAFVRLYLVDEGVHAFTADQGEHVSAVLADLRL
ncbi:MAG: hypothetical protein ACOC3G_00130 [Phycisphaeraceae bacterium]